jgi:hypothetical protein
VGGAGVAEAVGGAGVARSGEAEAPSHGDVGAEGSRPGVVVGELGGVFACKVAGVDVARTDSGERVSSLSSSWSRSSSASFRRRLDFLAGGGWISGEGGVSGAGGVVGRAGGGGSATATAAIATGGDDNASSSHTVVAARPHLRLRRRLPAAVSVTAGAGMVHETVRTWHPAT